MFEYKFVKIGVEEFRMAGELLIQGHAKAGWRLVQILPAKQRIVKSYITMFGVAVFAVQPPKERSPEEPVVTLVLERNGA